MDAATQRALALKAVADQEYAAAAAGRVGPDEAYCCEHAKKHDLTEARKEAKHWADWLGTRATLEDQEGE